jgi:hypothetical protein
MNNARTALYLDTCAIIEAHRVGCWPNILSRFETHTVKSCRDELAAGDPSDPAYVPVDMSRIDADVVVHSPTAIQVASAILKSATMRGVQDGERDLLAWCAAQAPGAMILTTGDRAAIVAACELDLKDSLRSLEELAAIAGLHPALQNHYYTKWLTDIRTKWLLENL